MVLHRWYQIRLSKKKAIRYEPQEKIRSFVLRLPEEYILTIDRLVEKGAAKSRNELIVEIISRFLTDLQREAQGEKSG